MQSEKTAVQMMWGNEYLDAGFSPIPNMVLRYAPKLITGKEFQFIMVLVTFKHDSNYPFPSQETLAEYMGVTTRQIRLFIQGLENKGYLKTYYRYDKNGRTSNVYNFQPLLDRCLKLHREKQMKKDIQNGVKLVEKKIKVQEENLPQLQEENLPQLQEENLPQPQEENLPMNITKENNKINITSRILQSINQGSFSDTLKGWLQKNIDRLIDININDIETIYNETSTTDEHIFINVLTTVLEHKPKKFKAYFKRSLLNELKNTNQSTKSSKNSKKTRTEYIPDWLSDNEDSKHEPAVTLKENNDDFEAKKRLFEERLAKNTNNK